MSDSPYNDYSQGPSVVTSNTADFMATWIGWAYDHNPCKVRPRSVFQPVTHNLANSQQPTVMNTEDMVFDACPDSTSLTATTFDDVNFNLWSIENVDTGEYTWLDEPTATLLFNSKTKQTSISDLEIIATEQNLSPGTYVLGYFVGFMQENTGFELLTMPI